MTILNRFYASSGSEVLIKTLEVKVGDSTYWLTNGWDDITATLENGVQVTFEACGIELSLPARNADGTQDLKFAICNIDGKVSNTIRAALDGQEIGTLTYRHYLSTDLSAPESPPFTLTIKSGYWTPIVVQITAGYMNVLDSAWPRNRYTLPDYPGLRYIS
ncbi:ArsR family transcriptional regulator [Serratia sp. MYb239]|uniref:DUF1833 family protein n=1 Tax=Serratia sp. MYb239 TaxID=2033438 RepID=UPI000CF5ECB9|nr:DUF1833 family protein [Serratia sp. MYb239]AVJ17221.1 ArsR family transcriptional regulator [Serratia sp. MYb239]QPT15487.1 DUF1833 family protein [Serratia rubidaea]